MNSSLVLIGKNRIRDEAQLAKAIRDDPALARAIERDEERLNHYIRPIAGIDERIALGALSVVSPLLDVGEEALHVIRNSGRDTGPGFVVLRDATMRGGRVEVYAGLEAEALIPAQEDFPEIKLRPLAEAPLTFHWPPAISWPSWVSWGVLAVPGRVFAWTSSQAELEMLGRNPARLKKAFSPLLRQHPAMPQSARRAAATRDLVRGQELSAALLLAATYEIRGGRSRFISDGLVLPHYGLVGSSKVPEKATDLDFIDQALNVRAESPPHCDSASPDEMHHDPDSIGRSLRPNDRTRPNTRRPQRPEREPAEGTDDRDAVALTELARKLSRRERELLELLRSEPTIDAAARRLGTAPSTARTMFQRIRQKASGRRR